MIDFFCSGVYYGYDGNKRQSLIQYFYSLNTLIMKTEICNSIRNQNLIEFSYDGGNRIVEPHCYGITTAGNEGLRAYQVEGFSSSGKMGWKMFDLSQAKNLIILDTKFLSPRTGYKKGDKGMSRIFEEI